MKDKAVIYIHGLGGNIDEARHYEHLFDDADIIGFDYRSGYPWEARIEFKDKISDLASRYQKITVIAISIGAYFLMNAEVSEYIDKAFFISPIVDMESLIMKMMMWNGVSEEELQRAKNWKKSCLAFGTETNSDIAEINGTHLHLFNNMFDIKTREQEINGVTAEDIKDYAKLIAEEKIFNVVAIGKDLKLDDLKEF